MIKRELNSILRELERKNVKDPDVIRQYMQTLGNRTLYSLMYGEKERCTADKRYECWSYLEFVLLAYTDLADLTEEEIDRCMKHMALKDFLCLAEHLNDRRTEPGKAGVVRDGVGSVYTSELAFTCLLRLILRAKGRSDKDVDNFCAIDVNSLMKAEETDEEPYNVTEILYILKENLQLNQDRVSWVNPDEIHDHAALTSLRKLFVGGMEKNAFTDGLSLPEAISRCREMGRGSG